jgi:hypothetical protein
MPPTLVRPSWYEDYWLTEPAPRRSLISAGFRALVTALAGLCSILARVRRRFEAPVLPIGNPGCSCGAREMT